MLVHVLMEGKSPPLTWQIRYFPKARSRFIVIARYSSIPSDKETLAPKCSCCHVVQGGFFPFRGRLPTGHTACLFRMRSEKEQFTRRPLQQMLKGLWC